MIRAAALGLTSVFLLVAYFGGVAPAIGPLFDVAAANTPSGTPVSGGIIATLETIMFVFVPLLFGGGAILLMFLLAVRSRGTSGVGR